MGQGSLVSTDGDGDLDGVARNGSHLIQHNAQTVDVMVQHLQDAVDVQVGDIVVALVLPEPLVPTISLIIVQSSCIFHASRREIIFMIYFSFASSSAVRPS